MPDDVLWAVSHPIIVAAEGRGLLAGKCFRIGHMAGSEGFVRDFTRRELLPVRAFARRFRALVNSSKGSW